MHTHTCIHAHIHIQYIHTYILACIQRHACMYAYIHMHMHAHTVTDMHTYIHTHSLTIYSNTGKPPPGQWIYLCSVQFKLFLDPQIFGCWLFSEFSERLRLKEKEQNAFGQIWRNLWESAACKASPNRRILAHQGEFGQTTLFGARRYSSHTNVFCMGPKLRTNWNKKRLRLRLNVLSFLWNKKGTSAFLPHLFLRFNFAWFLACLDAFCQSVAWS